MLFNIGQQTGADAPPVSPAAPYVKWDLVTTGKTGSWKDSPVFTLDQQTGLLDQPFSGWEQGFCLIDGQYNVNLTPTSAQIPGYGDLSHVQILTSKPEPGEIIKTTPKDTVFWIDNTPPVVRNVSLDETELATNPVTYKTTVKFTVTEPQVYDSYSGLPDRALPMSVVVYVDDTSYYAEPIIDNDGFWVTGALGFDLLKRNDAGINTDFSYSYVIELDGPLKGRSIEVETLDLASNQGRYILYPEGGKFS